MNRIVAVLALLTAAGCEPKQEAVPAAAADSAAALAPVPDTTAAMAADSIMVRDTAAVP